MPYESEIPVGVVIPVYRSEACLEATVAEFVAALEREGRFEIVLVNDGSPDRVQDVVERLCASDRRIRGIALGRNVGQHRATLHGFSFTRGDVVVTIDDDGQNPPAACLAVARALVDRDLDVVYGRFDAVEQSRPRRVASAVDRWISRHTIGNTGGLSITNVRAVRGDLARPGRCGIAVSLHRRAGLRRDTARRRDRRSAPAAPARRVHLPVRDRSR